MSAEQLEQRLAAIERTLADVVQRLDALKGSAPPQSGWVPMLPPMDSEEAKVFEEAMAYGRYYRKTGKDAPPDWKPGDPIPEPDPDWVS
jgi:hypothetical protein